MLKKFRRPVVSTPSSGSGALKPYNCDHNHGACTAKQRRRRNWQIPRRMFSRPTKAKRSEVASSKFGRAARTESLPAPKNFLQKRLSHKGYPLYAGRTIFGQVFGRGAVTKISK